jgi:hypothetical protein
MGVDTLKRHLLAESVKLRAGALSGIFFSQDGDPPCRSSRPILPDRIHEVGGNRSEPDGFRSELFFELGIIPVGDEWGVEAKGFTGP